MNVLQILHLEDEPTDATLVERVLTRTGVSFRTRVVQSGDDFERELKAERADVILSDFSIPGYDGLTALAAAQRCCPEVPFIFVSGRIGEEAAVDALKKGANDFLNKDRLGRLPAAIERVVKEAEERQHRRQLEEKFLRAQRMESLGILAGGIAHDLNNALLPILLGCEVLREQMTSDANREILAMMEASASRGSALVKQVLTFARGSSGKKLLMEPTHLVKDIAVIARRTLPANIDVRCDTAPDVDMVDADPTQIHQVLLNLVVNARDAMEKGGTLSLSLRNIPHYEVTDHFGGHASGKYVVIEVADTGSGIPEGIRGRIFEPFFTTKETGRGTGLGLATSLGIIKGHGGLIDYSTEVGRGTTFAVYLPAARGVTVAAPVVPSADLGGEAEVVLIIDDELGVRELTKAVLGRYAYQVLTASNGAEGLSTFARFKDRIHAVLVDHRMPLMEGPQTTREIRKLDAKKPIIGMSGYALNTCEEFMAAGANAFLPKPFSAEQVLALVKQVLTARAMKAE